MEESKVVCNCHKLSSRSVLQERRSLKFSRNSQENTCAGGPATLLKKRHRTPTDYLQWLLLNCIEHYSATLERNVGRSSKKDFCGNITLREKCPYSEFFRSIFSRSRSEYGEIWSISTYSVKMRENADQKNSKCGAFWFSGFLRSFLAFWLSTFLTSISMTNCNIEM